MPPWVHQGIELTPTACVNRVGQGGQAAMKKYTYPDAINPQKVGTYPVLVKSGAGFFYDEVLEYRVWCHPERGAPNDHGRSNDDYFYSFVTFAKALAFHHATAGSEEPLALIRQFEYVNEPEPGKFVHVKKERIAEWQCAWLNEGPRRPGQIEEMVGKKQ